MTHDDSVASQDCTEFLRQIADALVNEFGLPANRKWDALDTLIETILSQNTSDRNRDRAFDALKVRYSSWSEVRDADLNELMEVLRPAGMATTRAPRIKAVLRLCSDNGSPSISKLNDVTDEQAEEYLLALPGVGIKTAYVVMLFSLERSVFPMDVHILRIFERLGIIPDRPKIEFEHRRLSRIVPEGRHADLHLNLLKLGRTICRPREPRCTQCPLRTMCAFAEGKKQ